MFFVQKTTPGAPRSAPPGGTVSTTDVSHHAQASVAVGLPLSWRLSPPRPTQRASPASEVGAAYQVVGS